MADQKNTISDALSNELVELFDMKKARIREDKILTAASNEAQRDIRLLSLMFRDGIPDITMSVNDNESISWNSRSQHLVYSKGTYSQLLEATSKETLVRMRPFLKDLVKKAKDFFSDD